MPKVIPSSRATPERDPEYSDELSIDAGEIEAGYRLLCSSMACSDVELER